jgi:hypothetical protein
MTFKMFSICSNPDCSPLSPMVGTILKREYFDDPYDVRCDKCKVVKDKTVWIDPKCYCGGTMKPVRRWWLKCPKCGGNY